MSKIESLKKLIKQMEKEKQDALIIAEARQLDLDDAMIKLGEACFAVWIKKRAEK